MKNEVQASTYQSILRPGSVDEKSRPEKDELFVVDDVGHQGHEGRKGAVPLEVHLGHGHHHCVKQVKCDNSVR